MKNLLALLLIVPAVVFGQTGLKQTNVLLIKPAFIKAVNTNDFSKVENFIDSLNKVKMNADGYKSGAYFKVNREVVSGYRELIVDITEYYDKANSDGSIGESFKFYFIVKGKQILLSVLGQGGQYWEPLYKTFVLYKDDLLYLNFKAAFAADFDSPLDTTGLFNEDIAYGKQCGVGGANPHWKNVADSLVENNNRIGLMQLLQSTVTEKQLYGVEGFQGLKNKGVVLTYTELRLIKNVLRKNGKVLTCSGCLYLDEDMQKINKKFNF